MRKPGKILPSTRAVLLLMICIVGCDDDNPTLRVALSAQPTSISPTGTSIITALVTNSQGTPISGIAVAWGTNFASIGGGGGPTDANGMTTVILTGIGQTGVATITASLNSGETAQIQVPIN